MRHGATCDTVHVLAGAAAFLGGRTRTVTPRDHCWPPAVQVYFKLRRGRLVPRRHRAIGTCTRSLPATETREAYLPRSSSAHASAVIDREPRPGRMSYREHETYSDRIYAPLRHSEDGRPPPRTSSFAPSGHHRQQGLGAHRLPPSSRASGPTNVREAFGMALWPDHLRRDDRPKTAVTPQRRRALILTYALVRHLLRARAHIDNRERRTGLPPSFYGSSSR